MRLLFLVISIATMLAAVFTTLGISPTNLGPDGVAAISTPLAIIAAGTAIAAAIAQRGDRE